MTINNRYDKMEKKQLDKFINAMSSYAKTCKKDDVRFRVGTEQLDNEFKLLQDNVKKSMSVTKKPLRYSKKPRPNRTRGFNPTFIESPSPSIPPEPNSAPPKDSFLPAPYPTRHYALPVQPIVGARRYYQPKIKQKLMEEKIEQMDEMEKFPQIYPKGSDTAEFVDNFSNFRSRSSFY